MAIYVNVKRDFMEQFATTLTNAQAGFKTDINQMRLLLSNQEPYSYMYRQLHVVCIGLKAQV